MNASIRAVIVCTLCVAPAARAQIPSPPEVAVNHVYVHVDSTTLAAIANSAFLAGAFSSRRISTSQTADGRSWTGVYVFGERTYVEFFPEEVDATLGFTGLAFSVEQPGAIDAVAARLSTTFEHAIPRRLVEGVHEGRTYSWFHSLYVEHPRGDSLWQLHSWVMEVHPEFYRVVLQESDGPADDISRKRYLKRRYRPELMLRDIVGLSLALHPTIGEQLGRELAAFGWSLERTAEPGRFRAVGPEADIVVVPIERGAPYGLREIRFAVNDGPTTLQSHELGASRLDVCTTRARWTFGPLLPPPDQTADPCETPQGPL